MNFKALIFDFDGIITDTEPIHMEAWLEVFEPLGISFGEDEYREHYLGLTDRDFLDEVGRIHSHYFSDADKNDLIQEKTVASIRLLEHNVPLLPGASELISSASEKYILAICSGANRGEIEFILRHLRWENIFNPIIASDSVKKGKPDPEGYIRALEGIIKRSTDIILPEYVLAIEDSPKGIRAAKMAGLRCLAVRNSYEDEQLKEADWIVDSLSDFDPEELCYVPPLKTGTSFLARLSSMISRLPFLRKTQ